MSRRVAREAAIQVLYQIDVSKADVESALVFVKNENKLTDVQLEFASSLVLGVLSHLKAINKTIKKIALEWELERMAVVDRNIIRLALFEICYSDEVPLNVVANEAIELGKTFSTDESGRFINGILGKALLNPEQYNVKKRNIGV